MKGMTLVICLFILGSHAWAGDLNLTFCDQNQSRSRLIVKGDQARYTTPEKALSMTVIDRLSIEEDELTTESRQAGEKLTGGEALVLENYSSDVSLTVMQGESGAKYLGQINLAVDVIGSTANCP